MEGRKTALAAFGHSRDGRRDKRQITYGLLCDREGCPVAIEVFEGNAADPSTVGRQIDKICRRFGLGRVALVGDRGMVTSARIREELVPAGLDWISALKSTDIRKLAKGPLTADVPVQDAVAEIASPDFPGERLMVCFNPRLRDERRRKRDELLQAMEDRLEEIARIVRRRGSRLRGKEDIARRVGEAVGRLKVSKHFEIECEDGGLSWSRRQERIDREAALDGLWVVRTSLGAESIGPDEAVEALQELCADSSAISAGHVKTRFRIRCPSVEAGGMTSFLRASDRRGTGGRGLAPRPRRPVAAETVFIGAAEGRHIGRPAPRGKCGKDVVNPGPEQDAREQRRKGLSTGFPCCPRPGRAEAGDGLRNNRHDRHAASFRRSARRCS